MLVSYPQMLHVELPPQTSGFHILDSKDGEALVARLGKHHSSNRSFLFWYAKLDGIPVRISRLILSAKEFAILYPLRVADRIATTIEMEVNNGTILEGESK
jgi:hypothetical protein